MTFEPIVQSWKSGSVRGYNGDGIRIEALHRVQPDGQMPDKVDLRFFDNSERPNGPTSRLRGFPVDEFDWVQIPMPDPDGRFGENINAGFSIKGRVKLEPLKGGTYVRVDLNWGDEQVHQELGCVLKLGAD